MSARSFLASSWLLLACGCGDEAVPQYLEIANGSPERGKAVIAALACDACHVVPGLHGKDGRVGPSLEGFGSRALIAGAVPNRPDMLISFVRNAPALVPHTAMPPYPLTDQQARDTAAFLYTLR